MKELEKTYNPADIEDRLYQKWLDNKYFHADAERGRREGKKPFTIVMPPPNITGQLHMGHALDNTMQDILIRYKRMQGYEALWQPGTDHAAIATEVKVIDKLKKEGINKNDLGREGFLKEAWKWKDEYGTRIIKQLHKLGSSADWDRERFTMDAGCSEAVLEVFTRLYEKGYIYKGSRIINWCPVCQTSISDAEVELPLTDREIPVIADEYVDKEFGTGCVKITPAHDPNDFEVGKRHNLEEICIMNDDATINVPGKYFGMDRYEARKAMVEDLKEMGLLVKIVPHSHNVGTHDRCGTTVEPMVKPQWFVKMDEMAKPAIEALKSGKLRFVPESFGKTYLHWLEGIRDWCISRQLWWGHRIPAYYCEECGEMTVAKMMPEKCPKCGCTHLKQDEDTLDTWFSSALWPFSTLGWPKETDEMKYFYPTDVLVTGYDIIFFWVIRMVFSGLEQTGECPFNTVLIHGLVRDSQGRKMSKSLGNGIDPLEVIDKYGADALRMTLMTGNAPGNDMRFYWERVEASRNFANKVWNASRFIMMNIEKAPAGEAKLTDLTAADKWILSKVNDLAKEVTENMDKYELGIALQKVYDFVWEEFCDWYIEMVKPRLWNDEDRTKAAAIWTLKTVLINSLKLLHPFMPFITEEIFCNLQDEEPSIMISSWPVYKEEWNFAADEYAVEVIKEAVRSIRNVRTSMNVPPSRKAKVFVVTEDADLTDIFENSRVFFSTLASASEVVIQKDKTGIGEDAVSAVIPKAAIYMPFAELVDIEKETERLKKEEERLTKELARVNGMLTNEKFVSKAPQAKIDEEKAKLQKYTEMMEQVKTRLAQLGK